MECFVRARSSELSSLLKIIVHDKRNCLYLIAISKTMFLPSKRSSVCGLLVLFVGISHAVAFHTSRCTNHYSVLCMFVFAFVCFARSLSLCVCVCVTGCEIMSLTIAVLVRSFVCTCSLERGVVQEIPTVQVINRLGTMLLIVGS